MSTFKTSDRKREASLEYYRANAERINAERRAKRAADPEAARQRERDRRAAFPEKERERGRRYRERHPKKWAEKDARRKLKQYGLTPESFAELIAKQNGLCAICSEPLPERLHRHVDHCHKTGRVRGVLCQLCNVLLGMAKENPRTLARAIAYLGGTLQ